MDGNFFYYIISIFFYLTIYIFNEKTEAQINLNFVHVDKFHHGRNINF